MERWLKDNFFWKYMKYNWIINTTTLQDLMKGPKESNNNKN